MCAKVPGVTACEAIKNQGNRGCYAHTREVARGNGRRNHSCWVKKAVAISTSGKSSKIDLEKPSMNRPYAPRHYTADWALKGKTSITKRGPGNWWKASFEGGEQLVERVRVRNRVDCCGDRIRGTKVTISG